MKVLRFLLIAGMFVLFISASAGAGPIFRLMENSDTQGNTDCLRDYNHILMSLNSRSDHTLSALYPVSFNHYSYTDEPELVLAGMWGLQSEDAFSTLQSDRAFHDFMTPVFSGSLLVFISGFIKRISRGQSSIRYERIPGRTSTPFEKTVEA